MPGWPEIVRANSVICRQIVLGQAACLWGRVDERRGSKSHRPARRRDGPPPLRQCRRHERADGEGGNVESENRSWPRKNTKPAGLILKGEGRSDFEVFTEITPPLRSLFFCGNSISKFGLNAFARKEPVFSRKCQPKAVLRIIQKLEPARPATGGLGAMISCARSAWSRSQRSGRGLVTMRVGCSICLTFRSSIAYKISALTIPS